MIGSSDFDSSEVDPEQLRAVHQAWVTYKVPIHPARHGQDLSGTIGRTA